MRTELNLQANLDDADPTPPQRDVVLPDPNFRSTEARALG